MTRPARQIPCWVWDLTLNTSETGEMTRSTFYKVPLPKELRYLFLEHCDHYAYQLEQGEETHRFHYQCRIWLKERLTKHQVKEIFGAGWYATPTSRPNQQNALYVTKKETRVKGPWTSVEFPFPVTED